MSTAAGLGALGGALFLAARSSVLGLGRWIWIALVLMGIGFIAFAWATLAGPGSGKPAWLCIVALIYYG